MEFEWDEAKRDKTLVERDLDFRSADLFFDGRAVVHQATPRDDEYRWKTTGVISGAFVTIVWTWRSQRIRVISMRRAHGEEIRTYRQIHGY